MKNTLALHTKFVYENKIEMKELSSHVIDSIHGNIFCQINFVSISQHLFIEGSVS